MSLTLLDINNSRMILDPNTTRDIYTKLEGAFRGFTQGNSRGNV